MSYFEDRPTSAQSKALAMRAVAALQEAGVGTDVISEDDLHRILELAWYELDGDVEAATAVVVGEALEDVDNWEREFQAQVEAKQEQLGRHLTPAEQHQLRDLHEDVSDPDLEAAWEAAYGKAFSDEQIAAVEAKHREAVEKLRETGHTDQYIAEYDEKHRPDEKLAEMRRSGKGMFDLDDKSQRVQFMAEMAKALAPDQEPVEEPPDDASASERVQYMAERFREEERAAEETAA